MDLFFRKTAPKEEIEVPPSVYAPGLTVFPSTNDFINTVHILAIHGWNFRDR